MKRIIGDVEILDTRLISISAKKKTECEDNLYKD